LGEHVWRLEKKKGPRTRKEEKVHSLTLQQTPFFPRSKRGGRKGAKLLSHVGGRGKTEQEGKGEKIRVEKNLVTQIERKGSFRGEHGGMGINDVGWRR